RHGLAAARRRSAEVPGVARGRDEDRLWGLDLEAPQELLLHAEDGGAFLALALLLRPALADDDRRRGDVLGQALADRRQPAGELVCVHHELRLTTLLPLAEEVEHGLATDDEAGGEHGGEDLAATRLPVGGDGSARLGHQETSRTFP